MDLDNYDNEDFKINKKCPVNVRNAWDILNNKGLLHPGSTILRSDIEEALGMKFEDDWNFRGPLLLLMNMIKIVGGYFVTQRGIEDPGFRILNTKEMADYATNKIQSNLFSNWQVGYIMAQHDISKLSEDEQKKHKRVQYKAAQTSMIQQKILFDQSMF